MKNYWSCSKFADWLRDIEAVKKGLKQYEETKPTSFFRSQSLGSKNAVMELTLILESFFDNDDVKAHKLCKTLEEHEPTMGKTLKDKLKTNHATSSSYADVMLFQASKKINS